MKGARARSESGLIRIIVYTIMQMRRTSLAKDLVYGPEIAQGKIVC